MSRLAEQGHKVLFVDPPITMGWVFQRQVLRFNWSPRRLLTQVKKIEQNLRVFSPLNPLPFYSFMATLHAKRIKRLAERHLDPNRKTLLWIYHVEAAGLKTYLDTVDHDLLIYDCVDNYEGFPQHDTPEKKEKIRAQEEFLTKEADIVFATAPGLVEKLKNYVQDVHHTPNVGDYEKFSVVNSSGELVPPEDVKDLKHPTIGFTGALDEYKFDVELVKKLATENPDLSIVLIGQIALKDRTASLKKIGLTDLENVYFLGAKPYAEIQNYFACFDVYIIPYQLNDYTIGGCFPVKFHDALAAGLPTVVTDLPAYAPFKDVCYIAKDYDEFVVGVRKALEEDSDQKIKERKEVARNNTWDKKVEKMLAVIAEGIGTADNTEVL